MVAALLLLDELPGIGEVEDRPCDGPDDDDEKRQQECPGRAAGRRNHRRELTKLILRFDPP